MNVDPSNKLINIVTCLVQHYNPRKYWNRREIVVDPNNKTPKLIKLWYLFYIKRCDAYNNASFGTDLNQGAVFGSRPTTPHGLNGIIVHMKARIGINCTIYHQVTIASSNGGTPVIGDNVLIGSGAKVLGGVTIGNNVKIGANAVVVHDIPDNCTVVGVPAKIVKRAEG
ncbi:MAG: transferase [Clostridia bacterium]|nr:transferase [Clostridia bacterium]